MTSDCLSNLERAARNAARRRRAEARKTKARANARTAEFKSIIATCAPRIRREVRALADKYPLAKLDRLYRISGDLRDAPDDRSVSLPELHVLWKERRACLESECPEDFPNQDLCYVWDLLPDLELYRILRPKYVIGFRQRIAAFENIAALADQQLDPECAKGPSMPERKFISWGAYGVNWLGDPWDAQAALALCTVRLLEFVRKGRLVRLAAKLFK
jgi:hypothetical protein